jgi:hypothetical protein
MDEARAFLSDPTNPTDAITHALVVVAPGSHALLSIFRKAQSVSLHVLVDSFALVPLFAELLQLRGFKL